MSKYPFKQIEKKWQKYWDDNKTFKVTEDPKIPVEKRKYILDMFPYPSAAGLHVGHPEGYTATDIYSRFLKMNGYAILHPMGFDSFGLPAENYAIKMGVHPKVSTEENIIRFREQIKSFGFCYDWDRELSTHTSDYYKWTQWIFLKLYEKGLAYEAEMPINFCPSCKTGLANEEVKEGKCERCNTQVVRKSIRQWMLKITEYAERLLDDLESLDWTEAIKSMQRNWVGKSEGANAIFQIDGSNDTIEVYTTRPDTLFGATYMVLSPEHPLVAKVTTPQQKKEVNDYVETASFKSDLERTDLAKTKTGVFTGSYAINPVNNEKIPVWISDYVLITYGTGAIMAVPAHDERDFEFATKFKLPIRQVVSKDGSLYELKEAYIDKEDGISVNSGKFSGMKTPDMIREITKWLEEIGKGKKAINYKLRDWIFSRQRYWGEPIPIVHCSKCGIVPLREDQLPLTLPDVKSYSPTGTGESPLAAITEWVNTTCPACKAPGKRETNTMPQWAGSCWYYLRFIDPHNEKQMIDPEKEKYWMPVALYVGGAEHAVLHLLYARFWHKVLYDMGFVSTKEPFQRLVNQGMILGEGGVKMSKSLGNVINPDDVIAEFGSDSMRMYEMFMGPLSVSKQWSTTGTSGVFRFLDRVWRITEEKKFSDSPASVELDKLLHKTIKKVTNDTSNLDFNTAISQMMIFINSLYKEDNVNISMWKTFIKLLSPYAPHITEELWEKIGEKPSLYFAQWPQWDEAKTIEDVVVVVIQINSKNRSEVSAPKGISKEELEKLAIENERIKTLLEGKTVVKAIVVPDKLVNFVVK
ncbi:MAG: leucine--tRNA ligase [Spirochaetaceae bacterium]|nr:leucine--tRNA ligase [Spirochaetaceae bacterium]